MKIRTYSSNDRQSVIDLHKRTLQGTGADAPGPWDEDLKDIEGSYLKDGGYFLLIEINDGVVAMGAIRPISDTEGEIKRMRVDPKFQRQGLGQRLLENLIAIAKEENYYRLILDTTKIQMTAQAFYEKNGFRKYGNREWNGYEVLLYEKYLSNKAFNSNRVS